MKLSAAAIALAAAVLLGDNASSATSAGQCLSAVSAYAQSGQVETDGIQWNDKAAYYHIAFEAEADEADEADEDAEQEADEEQEEEGADRLRRRLQDEEEEQEDEEEEAAEEAEATIFDQMQGLAEALGIDVENDQAQQEGEEGEEANAEAQQYQDLTYVMAYDEELADALGIEDRDTFAKFYGLTYQLAKQGGCSAGRRLQDEEDEAEEEQENDEDENAEDAAEEDAAEEMGGDLIENILMNCQDSYEAIGINLEDIEEDNEAIKDLSLHIQIEQAIANGKLTITDGDYEQGFADLLELLGIDEEELDDEDAMNIKLKLAVKSGDLTKYLMENASYGRVVDDWDEFLQGFFESIGMEDVNLDNIDPYLAADIYNMEYDVEEYGCKAAMISQFGKKEAASRGYIEQTNFIKSFLDACSDKLAAGAIAGISIAVLAVVALVAYTTYRIGRGKASADKKAPLIDVSDKESDGTAEVAV